MAALARAKREDIEYAARALEPAARNRVHIFLSCSDLHLQYKLKITREQAEEQAHEMVTFARTYFDDVEFSPEDATRTDPGFLVKVVGIAVAAGATVIISPTPSATPSPRVCGHLPHAARARPRHGERDALRALPRRSGHGRR